MLKNNSAVEIGQVFDLLSFMRFISDLNNLGLDLDKSCKYVLLCPFVKDPFRVSFKRTKATLSYNKSYIGHVPQAFYFIRMFYFIAPSHV